MYQTELFDPEDFLPFPELSEEEVNRRTLEVIDRWPRSMRIERGWNPNGSTPVYAEEEIAEQLT